jgi:tRNA threonylcarbamoyladenosine modification (KEOPS) complex  Pcc1 subunit
LKGRAEIEVEDEVVFKALIPEVLKPPMTERVKLKIEGKKIIIEAEDLRALRAAINSFLYWIYSAAESLKEVESSHELASSSPEADRSTSATAANVREHTPASKGTGIRVEGTEKGKGRAGEAPRRR